MAVDSIGNLFVLGAVHDKSSILIYDPDGNLIYEMQDIDNGRGASYGLVMDYATEGFYTCGRTNEEDQDWLIMRFGIGPAPVNQPPVLDPIGNQEGYEGQLLEFQISASDPDEGDILTFSASNLPPGASFNPATATFSWMPEYGQAGNYEDVEFCVTDDGDPLEVDCEFIIITVGDVNRPPEFVPVPPQAALENQLLSFNVIATDPDGDETTLWYGLVADNVPCTQGDDGGQCVNYVRDFFGGSLEKMPYLCPTGDCGANAAWGYWDLGFGSGHAPAGNSILILDKTPLPWGHMGVVINATENPTGTYDLVVNESNWCDPCETIDCNVNYEFFPDSFEARRGSGMTLYPVLGFIYGQLTMNVAFDRSSGVFSFSPDNTQAGNYTVVFYATDDGEPSRTSQLEVSITVGDVPTPPEIADDIVDTVDNLELPKDAENSYFANLKKVKLFIESGKITPAINQLNAFIGKVENDIANGDIGVEDGNNLIAMAQELIAALTG